MYVGKNVKNIRDYAIGDRNFSTPALAATIIATYASGSGFSIDVTKGYQDGIMNLVATSGMSISLLIYAIFVAPRMKEFFGKLTVAEMLGDIYGPRVRVISSIPIFLKSAGFVAIQVKVVSATVEYFTGIETFSAVLLTTLILTLYSTLGGIKAVTYTDVVQFATFYIAIPLLIVVVYTNLDLPENQENYKVFIERLTYYDPSQFNQ